MALKLSFRYAEESNTEKILYFIKSLGECGKYWTK